MAFLSATDVGPSFPGTLNHDISSQREEVCKRTVTLGKVSCNGRQRMYRAEAAVSNGGHDSANGLVWVPLRGEEFLQLSP